MTTEQQESIIIESIIFTDNDTSYAHRKEYFSFLYAYDRIRYHYVHKDTRYRQ